MQVLGVAAALLLLLTAFAVYLDTTTRTRNATYVSIASQMQFHTQRLAKAAGLAARGQRDRVRAAAGQPRRIRAIPQDPPGRRLRLRRERARARARSDALSSRVDDVAKRWPESAAAATTILNAQKDLVALAQNVSQVRVGRRRSRRPRPRSSPASCSNRARAARQVLRANRITFLSERLGRGAAEILGSEVIDPEVPFLIGKDTNETRDADPGARERQRGAWA